MRSMPRSWRRLCNLQYILQFSSSAVSHQPSPQQAESIGKSQQCNDIPPDVMIKPTYSYLLALFLFLHTGQVALIGRLLMPGNGGERGRGPFLLRATLPDPSATKGFDGCHSTPVFQCNEKLPALACVHLLLSWKSYPPWLSPDLRLW